MTHALLAAYGRRLRWGMVGGGTDSVIGETHRLSARVDNRYDLVAGCLSIDPEIARSSARQCLIEDDRSYPDFATMAAAEAAREDGIEVVSICVPPGLHARVAQTFLESGVDVLCEKQMTSTLEEARALAETVRRTGRLFALTHCYTGYPVVREARALTEAGTIGSIRQVEADFAGGICMADDPVRERRHWRFRPEAFGRESILAELGCHAFNMAHFVTGAVPNAVTANMCTLVPDREVYDDAQILMRYADDTLGRMWCSLTAAGNEHGMGFRVYGTEGALVWRQERPQELILQHADGWAEAITPGYPDRLSPAGAHACRLRGGHPEGYILAFANLYRDFADTVMARNLGADADLSAHHFPTVQDGVETLRFFEAAVRSNAAGGAWVDLP